MTTFIYLLIYLPNSVRKYIFRLIIYNLLFSISFINIF